MQDDADPPDPRESKAPARPSQATPGPSQAPAALRPSQPPHASQPPRASGPPRSSIPGDPWKGAWRIVFAVVWVGLQIALVLTADRRPDGAFGYRMFTESSTMKIALYREIIAEDGGRKRVHVDDGVWSARDGGGLRRRFEWTDRVRRRDLLTLDVERNAGYGAAANIARLQAALDDVASHTPDDAETKRFAIELTIRRNGREPYVVHLTSAERSGGGI